MPFKEDLAHACRRWQAEEENARRLSARMTILATVTLGFLGVFLVQSIFSLAGGKLPPSEPSWVRWWVVSWMVIGLVLLLLAVCLLFDILRRLLRWIAGFFGRRRASPKLGPSSRLLVIPSTIREAIEIETIDHVGSGKASAAEEFEALNGLFRYHASRAINDAADEVHNRNSNEAARVGQAQVALVAGLVCIGLAVTGWVYTPSAEQGSPDARPPEQPAITGSPGDSGERDDPVDGAAEEKAAPSAPDGHEETGLFGEQPPSAFAEEGAEDLPASADRGG
jgi:hypothetical protein